MPRRASRSYAKKRSFKKRGAGPKRRRLQPSSKRRSPAYTYATPEGQPTRLFGIPLGRGGLTRRRRITGTTGKAKVDAATGGAGGFRVGRAKRMGGVLKRRQRNVLSTMANARYPVIKDHQLQAVGQLDWTSGTQGVIEYVCGYTTSEVQDMLTQANSAQAVSSAAVVYPAVGTLVNQRMDIYDKTTKFNFKNTSSHTVYLECVPYVPKIYSGYSVQQAWAAALAADNMNQDPATYGTEEIASSIGCRPDFRHADLNVRWKKRAVGVYKICLEPGQETSYTYVQKGGRFDQQKFNVLQGNSGTADDPTYMPGLSASLIVYARSEMVVDATDTDVTYGSGHIAVNREIRKSWAAVPFVKPFQASFQNAWGTVLEANELDLNQYQANNDIYEEQV